MDLKIENIAKLAGVSKTAVSFALNNKPGISDETRGKILDIVKEHGYVQRSLVKSNGITSESKTVLLLNCSIQQQALSFRVRFFGYPCNEAPSSWQTIPAK